MTGKTHFVGGVVGGLVVAYAAHASGGNTIAAALLSGLAALVPDRVQYIVRGATLPLEGHRGLSHTFLFAILTSLLFRPELAPYWAAGLVSHYILDLPSDAGLPLFWPIYRHRVALGWFKNGGWQETVTVGLLIAIGAWIVIR